MKRKTVIILSGKIIGILWHILSRILAYANLIVLKVCRRKFVRWQIYNTSVNIFKNDFRMVNNQWNMTRLMVKKVQVRFVASDRRVVCDHVVIFSGTIVVCCLFCDCVVILIHGLIIDIIEFVLQVTSHQLTSWFLILHVLRNELVQIYNALTVTLFIWTLIGEILFRRG